MQRALHRAIGKLPGIVKIALAEEEAGELEVSIGSFGQRTGYWLNGYGQAQSTSNATAAYGQTNEDRIQVTRRELLHQLVGLLLLEIVAVQYGIEQLTVTHGATCRMKFAIKASPSGVSTLSG